MSGAIDLDQKVYFELNTTVSHRLLSRVQKFLVDGATGNVRLNVKDGVILGAHIEEIVQSTGSQPNRRRTA